MRSKTNRYFWIGLIIFGLGIWLRLYKLGNPSLWNDETFTWLFARLDWYQMIDTVRLDGETPPVYYSIAKVFLDLFGDGEVALRLPSALAGGASILFAWLIGNHVGGRLGGIVGAWFIAFHPMALHYSRDARPYGLVTLLSLILFYIFIKLQQEDKSSNWGFALVFLILGQLTHYFFFMVGGSMVIYAVFDMKINRPFFRKWTLIWMLAFIPLALWLGWYFSQPSPSLGIAWIEKPVLVDPIWTFWNLLSGYGGINSIPTIGFGVIVLSLIIIGILHRDGVDFSRKVLVVGIILPILGVWIISQRRPLYVDRYFIVLLPSFVYLIGVGAQSLLLWAKEWFEGRAIGFVLVGSTAVWLLIGFWAGAQIHQDIKYSREDWRGLVDYYKQVRGFEQELWLLTPELKVPVQYYFRGDLDSAKISEDPLLCSHPCWWIMRQPYTVTHAFSQAISSPTRPWIPELPDDCIIMDQWVSETGLALWQVVCTGEVG